jgi:hypothetical protein
MPWWLDASVVGCLGVGCLWGFDRGWRARRDAKARVALVAVAEGRGRDHLGQLADRHGRQHDAPRAQRARMQQRRLIE